MTNEKKIRAAEARLTRKYNKRYQQRFATTAIIGLLRAYALFITFWTIGNSIRTDWFLGGPATLFRMFGVGSAIFSICLTIIDILAIRYGLNRLYNRAVIRMMMKLTK